MADDSSPSGVYWRRKKGKIYGDRGYKDRGVINRARKRLWRAGTSARSKLARGACEAGPRCICVGGPSALLTSEPHIALSRTCCLYIESVASRGGTDVLPGQAKRGWLSLLHMFWSILQEES
ncbi:hypothetical protein JG688_00015561 [Phytophthora aleatoria]|uniref:Uncharacterized protein n=1 Tax=Phytophthora aleatoria TaxID=2496075 RepID=A0A8J5I5B7_9STRA|nr:hypothetical protein JG688_00015561 [Phytophthora aleatoria]